MLSELGVAAQMEQLAAGVVRLALGELDEARRDYQEALELLLTEQLPVDG